VMMIPIPGRGVYKGVEGVDEASAVPGVDGVHITAKPDQQLVPLPEGNSYLGFIFARGETPEAVVRALRTAHGELRFDIAPQLRILNSSAGR
jgi:L-amino acid ligase C-terminal domain 2